MIRDLWSKVVLKEPVICCHKTSIVEERQIFNFYSLRKKNPVMCMVTEGESFHLHHRRVNMQRWKISHPISQKLTRVSGPPCTIGSKHSWNDVTIFIHLRFHEIFYKTLFLHICSSELAFFSTDASILTLTQLYLSTNT